MNQSINESMNQWIKQTSKQASKQASNQSMNQWIKQTWVGIMSWQPTHQQFLQQTIILQMSCGKSRLQLGSALEPRKGIQPLNSCKWPVRKPIDWRYLAGIRPIFQAYVQRKILAKNMAVHVIWYFAGWNLTLKKKKNIQEEEVTPKRISNLKGFPVVSSTC